MPSTVVALLALTFVITPGYLARYLRAESRPRPAESGTQELTRVAVGGLVYSLAAVVATKAVLPLLPGARFADPTIRLLKPATPALIPMRP